MLRTYTHLLLVCTGLLISSLSLAQMGPGPGGPPPGGGFGNQEERQRKTFGNENNATDAQQPRGNGKISGILLDSVTSKPVEYATVALLNAKTGKPIDGTTSDDKGHFALTKLAPGDYRLQYSFIGYKSIESALLSVKRGSDLSVGSVALPADTKTLGEVEVVGQKALLEEKVDRLVYNAEKDLTAKGGDATDILKKSPDVIG